MRKYPGQSWLLSITAPAVLIYLSITAVLVQTAWQGNAGFSYSLDAPYLELALAQHIAHGSYGINAGEAAAPVTTLLWPFLLAPFAEMAILQWLPLLLNLIAGLGVCLFVGCFLRQYGQRQWVQSGTIRRWILVLLFVIAANLPGLTMLGMEHTLQVLLAAGCAFAIAEAYFARRIPAWCLLCAGLGPAVRYENLAFTLAVCVACWLQRRRMASLLVAGFSLAPLVAFGFFWRIHGLGFAPPAVLLEGRAIPLPVVAVQQMGLAKHLFAIAAANARAYLVEPQRWPIALFFLALFWQAWRVRRQKVRRNALVCGLIAVLLSMAFGPYGYFYRYDVACRFFAFLLIFAVAAESEYFGIAQAWGLAAGAAIVYLSATVQTPGAAWAVAHEQKQLHRLTHNFYGNGIAASDAGWIAFDSRDRFYVLNVPEALADAHLHSPDEVAAWFGSEAGAHKIGLALISPYHSLGIPVDWRREATLYRYGDGFNHVDIYGTQVADSEDIRKRLHSFASTLPSGTWVVEADGTRSDVNVP